MALTLTQADIELLKRELFDPLEARLTGKLSGITSDLRGLDLKGTGNLSGLNSDLKDIDRQLRDLTERTGRLAYRAEYLSVVPVPYGKPKTYFTVTVLGKKVVQGYQG